MPVDVFLADKGFDSEKNHERAEKCGARFIAPLRANTTKVMRTMGVHRKKLRREFPQKEYNQRSIIESIFSSIKRRFGSLVYAKKFKSQKNEILFRVLAYNLDKLVNAKSIYFLQSLEGIKIYIHSTNLE
ncbi:MAG: transposase [Nanoarchaeota archaeon]|nr:transposase [Nanoarchaeota archaeon]